MTAPGGPDRREWPSQLSVPVLVAHGAGRPDRAFHRRARLAAAKPDWRFLPADTVNLVGQEDEPAWPVLLGAATRFPDAHPPGWAGWRFACRPRHCARLIRTGRERPNDIRHAQLLPHGSRRPGPLWR